MRVPTSSLHSRLRSSLRSGDNSPNSSFLLWCLFLLLSGQQQSRWITSRPSPRRSSYTPGVKRSAWGQRWYLLIERAEEKEGGATQLTMWFPNSTSIRATINITAPPYCWARREMAQFRHLVTVSEETTHYNIYVLHSQVCLQLWSRRPPLPLAPAEHGSQDCNKNSWAPRVFQLFNVN